MSTREILQTGRRLASARAAGLTFAALMTGCQQLPPRPAALTLPAAWDGQSGSPGPVRHAAPGTARWWELLGDPAIDAFVPRAFADNPDLEQALARVDQASAALGTVAATGRPTLAGTASVTRASNQVATSSSVTQTGRMADVGANVGWEVDLFGRIRAGRDAARFRLDARAADVAALRVSIAAQIADRVIAWRACHFIQGSREREIASRESTLTLVRERIGAGFDVAVDESRARSDLATARAAAITQAESCRRELNALVALSGFAPDAVRAELAAAPLRGTSDCSLLGVGSACEANDLSVVPRPPRAALALPAELLLTHPAVVAAQLDAAAAWADIDAARAARYPRLDLAGLLTGQWLRVGGQALFFSTWTTGVTASGAILDGGAASAQIDAAGARYREVTGRIMAAVRSSARDIEDALAAAESAEAREAPSEQAVRSAHRALQLTELQWRAGATTLLVLEDARRQDDAARSQAVTTARDRAEAWTALVRATGNQGWTAVFTALKD